MRAVLVGFLAASAIVGCPKEIAPLPASIQLPSSAEQKEGFGCSTTMKPGQWCAPPNSKSNFSLIRLHDMPSMFKNQFGSAEVKYGEMLSIWVPKEMKNAGEVLLTSVGFAASETSHLASDSIYVLCYFDYGTKSIKVKTSRAIPGVNSYWEIREVQIIDDLSKTIYAPATKNSSLEIYIHQGSESGDSKMDYLVSLKVVKNSSIPKKDSSGVDRELNPTDAK